MKNIMVIFGGKSVEHDISIITGVQVANALAFSECKIFVVFIDRNNNWNLCKNIPEIQNFKNYNSKFFKKVEWVVGKNDLFAVSFNGKIKKKIAKIDCVILCNHGKNGEDGSLSAVFQLSGVPYSASNLCSCALSLDKKYMKDIFIANNIPSVKYAYVEKTHYLKDKTNAIAEITKKLNNNIIVKPANLGSSIGITTSNNDEELEKALDFAFNFDNKVVVEERLQNFVEVNCSVRKNNKGEIVASECDYPNLDTKIFTFEAKYIGATKNNKNNCCLNGKMNEERMHLLDEIKENAIKQLSINVYKIFNSSGIIRVDFIFDKNSNTIYVNEINTIPGSLSMNLWLKSGVSSIQLMRDLIKNTEDNCQNNLIECFESSVLEKY